MGGDMALSVSIGILSTCLANLFIPIILSLCALLYPQIWSQIPWLAMGFTLLGLLLPIFLGMLTLHFKPIWGYYISRSATFWGAFVVLCSVVIGILSWREMFLSNWEVYVTAIIVGVVSLTGGTVLSLTFRLSPFELRAVIMQTSLQNTPLALSIIQLAFPNSCAPLVQLFPLFYTLWMMFMAIVVCVVCFYLFPVINEPEIALNPETFQRTRGNSFTSIHALEATEMNMVTIGTSKLRVDTSVDRATQNALKKSAENSDALNIGSLGSHILSIETPPALYATPLTTPVSSFGNFGSVLLQKSIEDDRDSQIYQIKKGKFPKSMPSVESFPRAEPLKPTSIMDWFPTIPWSWSTSTDPATNSSLPSGSVQISPEVPVVTLDSEVVLNTETLASEFTIVDAVEDEEEDESVVHFSTHRRRVKFVDEVKPSSLGVPSVRTVRTVRTSGSDDDLAWESAEEYADSIQPPGEGTRRPSSPPAME
ncbi:hypothetical protein HK096_007587, partial [Nowakowskiella sp. JEL0078]